MTDLYKCKICMHDCKKYNKDNCEHFKVGTPISEYIKIIQYHNVNLHKVCQKHNLKYSLLKKMLKGKMDFAYKYRICLEEELYEKDEYTPYLKDMEVEISE